MLSSSSSSDSNLGANWKPPAPFQNPYNFAGNESSPEKTGNMARQAELLSSGDSKDNSSKYKQQIQQIFNMNVNSSYGGASSNVYSVDRKESQRNTNGANVTFACRTKSTPYDANQFFDAANQSSQRRGQGQDEQSEDAYTPKIIPSTKRSSKRSQSRRSLPRNQPKSSTEQNSHAKPRSILKRSSHGRSQRSQSPLKFKDEIANEDNIYISANDYPLSPGGENGNHFNVRSSNASSTYQQYLNEKQ